MFDSLPTFVFTWQLKILVTTLNWQKLNSIEAVEGKAARFFKNCCNREPRTVTRLIQEINWEPLQMRPERAKLMLFFKISQCHHMSSHYVTAEPVSTILRDTLLWTFALTPKYKGSFFPATINLWKCLPPEVITQPNIKASRLAWKIFIWIDLLI